MTQPSDFTFSVPGWSANGAPISNFELTAYDSLITDGMIQLDMNRNFIVANTGITRVFQVSDEVAFSFCFCFLLTQVHTHHTHAHTQQLDRHTNKNIFRCSSTAIDPACAGSHWIDNVLRASLIGASLGSTSKLMHVVLRVTDLAKNFVLVS
jgi:hypothetical protein